MNLVTIATHVSLGEAEMTRSRLEAAGFHTFIANETAAGWPGGNSTATLVRIEVPAEEAGDAKQFLDAPVQ